MQGWGALFKEGYATDSTSAIAVTIALFIAPARPPVFDEGPSADTLQIAARSGSHGVGSDQAHAEGRAPMPRCLDWETAIKIPWGIILLLGGGFAIADAFDASGLNHWLGCRECTGAQFRFQTNPDILSIVRARCVWCAGRAPDFQGPAAGPRSACGVLCHYIHDRVHLKHGDVYDCDAGAIIAVAINDDQSDGFVGARYV